MSAYQNAGEIITLEEAVQLTHAFQKQNPNATKSYLLGRKIIDKIMQQPDCHGLRIYPGLDLDAKQTNLILIGVDQRGEDIKDGIIADRFQHCPPHCPDSPLIK